MFFYNKCVNTVLFGGLITVLLACMSTLLLQTIVVVGIALVMPLFCRTQTKIF